jgi:hypothetical protein
MSKTIAVPEDLFDKAAENCGRVDGDQPFAAGVPTQESATRSEVSRFGKGAKTPSF